MITIVQQPQLYTPAFNKNIIEVSSDISNLLYFLLTITESDGVTPLSVLKIYPTPANRTTSKIDLSNILKNNVNTIVKGSGNIVEAFNSISQYKAIITDYNIVSNVITSGSTNTSSFYFTWNGKVDELLFPDYSTNDYIMNNGYVSKFLTSKPQYSTNFYYSTDYLYLLNKTATRADIKCYYNDGTTATFNKTIDNTKDTARLDVSPRQLKDESIDLSKLKYYEVKVVNASSTLLSDVIYRTYKDSCSNVVNVVWLNQYGGIDSYSFSNVDETQQTSKITATVGTDDVYANDEIVIATNPTSNYTVVSDWLTNESYRWITKELLNTKSAFVQLTNGKLLPIKITNVSERIKNTNKSGDMIFNLTFTALSGLAIPYGEGLGIIGTGDITKTLPQPAFEIVV